MKKTIAIILTAIMILAAFAGCGQTENGDDGSEQTNIAKAQTLRDIIDSLTEEDDYQSAYSDETFIFAYSKNGVYYRAFMDMTEEMSDDVWNMEYDDSWLEGLKNIAGSLEVKKIENLSEKMPSQEELDKLIGKNGQYLMDEGWGYWYYNLLDMEAGMSYKEFEYTVKFEYDGEPMENTDDFDFWENFKDLTIKSVTCDGIGNATYIEEE
ncbi:MAG: hypothetical protein IJL30_09110 [Clostridia bacterium]|nr:hypothetical protein [Clostridia bacterium]